MCARVGNEPTSHPFLHFTFHFFNFPLSFFFFLRIRGRRCRAWNIKCLGNASIFDGVSMLWLGWNAGESTIWCVFCRSLHFSQSLGSGPRFMTWGPGLSHEHRRWKLILQREKWMTGQIWELSNGQSLFSLTSVSRIGKYLNHTVRARVVVHRWEGWDAGHISYSTPVQSPKIRCLVHRSHAFCILHKIV